MKGRMYQCNILIVKYNESHSHIWEVEVVSYCFYLQQAGEMLYFTQIHNLYYSSAINNHGMVLVI